MRLFFSNHRRANAANGFANTDNGFFTNFAAQDSPMAALTTNGYNNDSGTNTPQSDTGNVPTTANTSNITN